LSCSAGVSEPDGEGESASEIPSAAEGPSGSKIEPQRAPVRLACARSGQATNTRRCGRRGIRGWGDLGFGGHHL